MNHALYAPSAAARWMTCPGSIKAQLDMPDRPNEAAEFGTECHEAAAAVLEGDDEYKVLGMLNDEQFTIVRDYLQFIGDLQFTLEQKHDRVIILTETNFAHPLLPDYAGTSDAVFVAGDTLIVVDLKTGFVPVELRTSEDKVNPQLASYMLLAMKAFPTNKFEHFEAWIVQPRVYAKPIKMVIPKAELLVFEQEVFTAIARINGQDDTRVAGKHCKYCLVKGSCKTHYEYVIDAAKIDFANVQEPRDFSDSELSEILDKADQIQTFLDAVRAYALRVMENGGTISGFKLVPKRPVDKWLDPDVVIDQLELSGVSSEYIYTQKLKTPKQIEKVLSELGVWDDFSKLHAKISSGNTVAPLNDHRKAAKPKAGAEFDD